jgi:AcrR family transcriptional regulator
MMARVSNRGSSGAMSPVVTLAFSSGVDLFQVMGRPAKHSEDRILHAAGQLVSERGPAATTITAIGQALGAPSGSIYHRFRTRDELLGKLWLSKARLFQGRVEAALKAPDAKPAALAAAHSILDTAREDMIGARIMLLYRREDFFVPGWPASMKRDAERLGQQAHAMVDLTARRLFGKSTTSTRQAMRFAMLEAPVAAIKSYVACGEAFPDATYELIRKVFDAVIDDPSLSSARNKRRSAATFEP